ncbi:MAG: pyridoxamine 5'-phosphate oxidase family protein [Chloroflexota bacterium]
MAPIATTLPDHVRRFLVEQPRYLTISTIDPDGAPRQAVIWFLLDGDELVINSRVGRRWPSNLLRDPRIAASVSDSAAELWVGFRGEATAVPEPDQAQSDIAEMARRFHRDPATIEARIREFEAQRRISFRVRIAEIHDHLA